MGNVCSSLCDDNKDNSENIKVQMPINKSPTSKMMPTFLASKTPHPSKQKLQHLKILDLESSSEKDDKEPEKPVVPHENIKRIILHVRKASNELAKKKEAIHLNFNSPFTKDHHCDLEENLDM